MNDTPWPAARAIGYQGSDLYCESVPLTHIAETFGTPTYVYSQRKLRANAQTFLAAAQGLGQDCLICYAVKANGNLSLLRILAALSLGADIVSGGELYLALRAGFEPQRIVFSGVGKTRREIEEAITAGILALHVESEEEQRLISRVARTLGTVASIAVRVNPDIEVDTHAHVATGQKGHKFGVAPEMALTMMRAAHDDPWLHPVGLSAHLGSQITAIQPYVRVAEKLGAMADDLGRSGLQLDYLDIGGGLAIDYDSTTLDSRASGHSVTEWLATASLPVSRRGLRLLVEPGRSIVGSAGLLLTSTLYTKNQASQGVIITDAGMTDLLRPALYGAQHPILAVTRGPKSARNVKVDVAGPVCESTDYFARDLELPDLAPGDLLAILQAGAYGFVMSSNYNGRPRPAEVLVDGEQIQCIRQRESYATLLGSADME